MKSVEEMLKQYAQIRKAYAKHLCNAMKHENFSPSEIDILIFLSNNPSIHTSKELTLYLGISKSLVCRSVESLLQRGLLTTKEDTKDRRIQRLNITDQAYPVIREIKQCQKIFTDYVMKDISEEEMERLEQTMKKINQNWERVMKGEINL